MERLTDDQIKQAPLLKEGQKLYRKHDQGGLYIEITQKGSKRWRFRYKFQGKEKQISLGVYPKVSLQEARKKHQEMIGLLSEGKNPSTFRKLQTSLPGETLEEIGRDWHSRFRHTWTAKHAATILYRLETNIFPYLGNRVARDIEPPEILACLRKIEARGHLELARRVRENCGQVFRYAVATGRARWDITRDLRGAIPPAPKKHFPRITDPKQVGELICKIDQYPGMFITRQALRLTPLVFVRPGELRHAEWTEIDLEQRLWKIPAEKMKMRKSHIVPLSRQSIEILKQTKQLSGRDQFVFPSQKTHGKAMSENTINQALRRLGYPKDVMCGHGFRATACTLLNEEGWHKDLVEIQLSHVEPNKSREPYHDAIYLEERIEMMQAWSDFLDTLRGKISRVRQNSHPLPRQTSLLLPRQSSPLQKRARQSDRRPLNRRGPGSRACNRNFIKQRITAGRV